MSEFLDKLNEDFNNKGFNEWYIDNIIFFYINTDDQIKNIILKYNNDIHPLNLKSFKVDDIDAGIIKTNYKNEYNVLIRSVLDYLLSNSSKRKESKLINDCDELMDLYFKNLDMINGGLPIHNLSTVISWTVQKFPNNKNIIHDKIFNKVINDTSNKIELFTLIDYFITKKELTNIFSKDDYYEIYKKYYVDNVKQENVYLYLDCYKNYIKYIETYDKFRRKNFLRKYVNYVFNIIDLIDFHTKQRLLRIVRDYMDELDDFSNEKYNFLDLKLKEANDSALKTLQSISISLPEDQQKRFLFEIDEQIKKYNNLNNSDKIDKLINETKLISLLELQQSIEKNENTLTELFSHSYLDEDGKIINYKELSENNIFSLKSNNFISIHVEVYSKITMAPFFNTYKNDSNSKKYIKEILSNNYLVSSDRVEILSELFYDFFEGNYRHSVYDIVLELEESLRYYLKNEGINIYKKDGSHDLIGLNNIFNDYKNNSFRDKILETIDDDFYFTLKWFLTDEYGYDMRNKVSHRYKSNQLYKRIYSVFIIIQIFRLYWGFQK